MKLVALYLAASAVALSGAALWADTPGVVVDRNTITTSGTENLTTTLADEKTAGDIQVVLSKCINDSLSENKFDALITHLSKPDRDRIGAFKGQRLDDLNRSISLFRADFKAKYNQDFDFRPDMLKDSMVYLGPDKNTATVTLSESVFLGKSTLKTDTRDKVVTEIGRVVTEAVPAPTGNPASDASSSALGNRTSADSFGENSNTVIRGSEAPRATIAHDKVISNTAVDKSKPIAGASVTLTLVRENAMAGWKINIPNEISGDQLRSNLIKHIQMLDDQKAAWGPNPSDCCHAAAYHVLEALNDTSMAIER